MTVLLSQQILHTNNIIHTPHIPHNIAGKHYHPSTTHSLQYCKQTLASIHHTLPTILLATLSSIHHALITILQANTVIHPPHTPHNIAGKHCHPSTTYSPHYCRQTLPSIHHTLSTLLQANALIHPPHTLHNITCKHCHPSTTHSPTILHTNTVIHL